VVADGVRAEAAPALLDGGAVRAALPARVVQRHLQRRRARAGARYAPAPAAAASGAPSTSRNGTVAGDPADRSARRPSQGSRTRSITWEERDREVMLATGARELYYSQDTIRDRAAGEVSASGCPVAFGWCARRDRPAGGRLSSVSWLVDDA